MEFETAFDVAETGYRYWWLPAAALLPFAVGLLMAWAPPWSTRILGAHVRGRWARFFGVIFAAVGAAWAGLSFMNTWNDYRFHRDALRRGEFRTVQGTVENFRALQPSGVGLETFEVSGRRFQYHPDALSAGYNRAAADGGHIAEGVYVRIAYINLAILRLELRKR
jgi:hypothetical protein